MSGYHSCVQAKARHFGAVKRTGRCAQAVQQVCEACKCSITREECLLIRWLGAWVLFVQAFHQHIEPSMQCADIVVPRGAENKVAMQLIVNHVKDRLKNVSQLDL